MFGLEDQKKKKKVEEQVFDLETNLKNTKKHQEIKKLVESSRIQKIKEVLRGGESKDEFDQFGVLSPRLHLSIKSNGKVYCQVRKRASIQQGC